MASDAQVASLRLKIAEATDAAPFDTPALKLRIDAASSLEALAAEIWREKAAQYSALVDTTEGSSKRTMSQMYKQALEMSTSYGNAADTGGSGSTSTRGARTRPIVRL